MNKYRILRAAAGSVVMAAGAAAGVDSAPDTGGSDNQVSVAPPLIPELARGSAVREAWEWSARHLPGNRGAALRFDGESSLSRLDAGHPAFNRGAGESSPGSGMTSLLPEYTMMEEFPIPVRHTMVYAPIGPQNNVLPVFSEGAPGEYFPIDAVVQLTDMYLQPVLDEKGEPVPGTWAFVSACVPASVEQVEAAARAWGESVYQECLEASQELLRRTPDPFALGHWIPNLVRELGNQSVTDNFLRDFYDISAETVNGKEVLSLTDSMEAFNTYNQLEAGGGSIPLLVLANPRLVRMAGGARVVTGIAFAPATPAEGLGAALHGATDLAEAWLKMFYHDCGMETPEDIPGAFYLTDFTPDRGTTSIKVSGPNGEFSFVLHGTRVEFPDRAEDAKNITPDLALGIPSVTGVNSGGTAIIHLVLGATRGRGPR